MQVIRHLTYQSGKTANAEKTNDTDSVGTTRASLLQPFEKKSRRSKELVNSSLSNQGGIVDLFSTGEGVILSASE